MAASYPSSIRVFTTKTNVTDVVDASHPNSVQEEVVAIESTLGASPQVSTAPSPSGTFTATATSFASVNARLANIETGVVSDAHSQYIRKAGDTGNVIIPSASSTKGLVVKGAASQSANLFEAQNSAGTVVSSISSGGSIMANLAVSSSSSTSYALTTADRSRFLVFTGGTTVTVTVPTNSTQAFETGTVINLFQSGVGQVVVAPVSGTVTIVSTPGLKLRARYSSASLIKIDTDAWVLVGDLSA
jgi:hypothetical protein